MTGADTGSLIGIILLLVFAGVLAAAEVSITRMTRARALSYEEEKRRGSASLVKIVEAPARYLNVVLLLTLVCHIGAATLATDLALRHDLPLGEVIATVVMTVLIFTLAEVSPKTFTVQHTDRVALQVSGLVNFLGRAPLLYPLSRFLIAVANVILPGKGLPKGPFVTEEEIRQMASVAAEEEAIEEEEKEMIHSIFEFGDTVVREVMIPRPDMVGVDITEDLNDVLTKMLEHGYSRMPVWETGDPDKTRGLVYAKDVMRKLHGARNGRKAKLKDILRKAMFVPESKKVAELLREMQTQKMHMALVVDEYGDTAGLVTLEDLLEEIVGEIADEYDREEPQVQPIDENTLLVSGKFLIDELSELVEVELPNTEWDTVGGLMAGLLGKLPAEGDEVRFQGLTFRAERVQGRRISKILVTKASGPA